MIVLKYASGALAMESAAIASLFFNGSNDMLLLSFLMLHALASVLLSLLVISLLPSRYTRPRVPILGLLFCMMFFMPMLSLIGLFTAMLISGINRRTVIARPYANLELPEFVLSLREPEGRFSQGGIKSRLAHVNLPTPVRLQSLLALQGMPSRISNPLLQDLLGDASEDIRLVAYGLLDSREKKITAQIHHELANLKTVETRDLRLISLRHLAELYWELVYAGLAQGDLRLHALNQALAYVDSALELMPDDNGLSFLKGRILHELKRNDEAYRIFGHAMQNGLPESRVLPYIVEIAFDRGDYATVRSLLARISMSQVTPVMRGAIRFWVGHADTGSEAGVTAI